MYFYQHAYRCFFLEFLFYIQVAISNMVNLSQNVQFFPILSFHTTPLTNITLFFKKVMEVDFAVKFIFYMVNSSHVGTQSHF